MFVKPALATLTLLALTACSGNDGLRSLDSGLTGPDEFSVLPALPLQTPETLALPVPTPGGRNLTDQNPTGDAIAALGGSQSAAFAGGIPATDAALVAHASRNGTDPAIRSTLAAEDAQLRSNAEIGGVFNILARDRYYPAYAAQALDAYAELARFAALGTEVPTPPPEQ